ncbi:hypothetical protein B9Z55_003380 [Caenorhabditis nigoni]|nr:hypothetical protein B9Z55_003380 [Caenorhabditis nigoni]
MILLVILIFLIAAIGIAILVVLLHHGSSEGTATTSKIVIVSTPIYTTTISTTTTTTKIPTTTTSRIVTQDSEKTSSPEKTTITSSTSVITTHLPDDTSCSPKNSPQTLLFAYSNDLSSQTVLDTLDALVHSQLGDFYSWIGNVRFDTENKMDIQFHKNMDDTTAAIRNNLPDEDQGFQNSGIGSDVFDVIEKFFFNTEAPVCGSIILILLKRNPNEVDISRLVSLIRSHHAIVHVVASATPSGGSQPKTMYSVTSKTNGMGAFEYDEFFPTAISNFPLYSYPYPVYATTVQISGSWTTALPDWFPPVSDIYLIAVTYQDHVSDGSLQDFFFCWNNPKDSGSFSVLPTDVDDYWHGGNYESLEPDNFRQGYDYSMVLDYNYTSQDVQNVQIRIYSSVSFENESSSIGSLPILPLFFFDACLVISGFQNDKCTPKDNTSYLIAYSNDIGSELTLKALNRMHEFSPSRQFVKFAKVRFDVQQPGEIEYLDSPSELTSSTNSSYSIGSDVISVLEKFLENTQYPVCGSRINVLVKRLPTTEVDVESIIAKLRKFHVGVYFAIAENTIGGNNLDALNEIAFRTNGLSIFLKDDMIDKGVFVTQFIGEYTLIYAANFNVSGQGTIELPPMTVPNDGGYKFLISFKDDPVSDTFQSATITCTHTEIDNTFTYTFKTVIDAERYINFVTQYPDLDKGTYTVKLEYEYANQDVERLFIRVSNFVSAPPVDYWVPYDN